jgi:hypothetical protein
MKAPYDAERVAADLVLSVKPALQEDFRDEKFLGSLKVVFTAMLNAAYCCGAVEALRPHAGEPQ